MQEIRPDATSENTNKLSTLSHQILPIYIQKNLYAIDLKFVECVLPLTVLQPIDNGADYLIGLMNYRGMSIPVIDLGQWLGIKPTESYNLDTPIVVCKNGQKQAAFVVSDVMQVEVVDTNSVQIQKTLDKNDAHFEATVNLERNRALLFNMKHVLSTDFTAANADTCIDSSPSLPGYTVEEDSTKPNQGR